MSRRFADLVGHPPAVVWVAPGRVNLIGEHTNYNAGFALPVAIDRVATAAVAPHSEGRLRCWSVQQHGPVEAAYDAIGPGRCAGWSAYMLGVAWALHEGYGLTLGADIVIDSDVPVGAGLASSAAVTCAVASALVELAGLTLDRTQVALVCQRAENEMVGAPTGVMDQLASMHGRTGAAVLLDGRSLSVTHVPLDLADLRLLVIDTGVRHAHATGAYAERRRACAEAARLLGVDSLRDVTLDQLDGLDGVLRRRARHVVTENARVLSVVDLLRAGDVHRVGPVLCAGHASLRDDFEVSVPELDVAVDVAVEAGALGARMTGGGFGGSVVALVPADLLGAVGDAVAAAYAERGCAAPQILVVSASAGARQLP
ncbi:MAG: galactokinase [Mycobacteriales bacterium]